MQRKGDIPILKHRKRPYIETELIHLGMSTKCSGTHYVADIIEADIDAKGGWIYEPITKVIYPAIAKFHHVSAASVERAIRYAIEDTFLHMDPDLIAEYFPRLPDGAARPSNQLFVQVVARICRDKLTFLGLSNGNRSN